MHEEVGEQDPAGHTAQRFGDIEPGRLFRSSPLPAGQDAAGVRELETVQKTQRRKDDQGGENDRSESRNLPGSNADESVRHTGEKELNREDHGIQDDSDDEQLRFRGNPAGDLSEQPTTQPRQQQPAGEYHSQRKLIALKVDEQLPRKQHLTDRLGESNREEYRENPRCTVC